MVGTYGKQDLSFLEKEGLVERSNASISHKGFTNSQETETEGKSKEPTVVERALEVSDETRITGTAWSSSTALDISVVIFVALLLITTFLVPSSVFDLVGQRITDVVMEMKTPQIDQSFENAAVWVFGASSTVRDAISDFSVSIPTFLQEKVCDIVGDCFA